MPTQKTRGLSGFGMIERAASTHSPMQLLHMPVMDMSAAIWMQEHGSAVFRRFTAQSARRNSREPARNSAANGSNI